MNPIEESKLSLTDKGVLNILKKNANNFYSSYPFRINWKSQHNLLITSFFNNKSFNDMLCTFQLLSNSKVDYKGEWLKVFNNNTSFYQFTSKNSWFNLPTFNYLKRNIRSNFVLDTVFTNIKRSRKDVYSLVSAQFFGNEQVTIWLLHCQNNKKNYPFDIYKQDINLNEIIWYRFFPYYVNIDSEFCDKIQKNTIPYDNIRDRFPVSVTATSINIFSGKKKFHHFLFNKAHLKYLLPYRNNDDMFVADYDESLSLYQDVKIPFYIKEKTPFFIFLYSIYKNIDPNLEINDCSLYLCSEFVTYSDKNFKKNSMTFLMHIFWSAKDFRFWFGYVSYMFMEPLFDTKTNNITFEKHKTKSNFGFIFQIKQQNIYIKLQIIDIARLSERGLEDLGNLTGVPLPNKHNVNKEDISQTLISNPSLYLDYCRQDTENLDVMAKNSYINLVEIYEIFNIKNIPSYIDFSSHNPQLNYMRFTSGSNVSRFFEEYIYNLDPSMKHTLNLLSIKAGDETVIDGISMGGPRYLNYLGSHAIMGCYVAGGRTITERLENVYYNGYDADFAGAYSNSIKIQYYCVGIPFVVRPLIDTSENEKGQIKYIEPFIGSLKEVLKNFSKYFVSGCWEMIVSTKEPLSFAFDLIISKDISTKPLKHKPESNTSNQTVPGDQFILLHEIKNGIIVQSTLDIIEQVATRNEKIELYEKIQVKEVIYYDKRYQCKDTAEFNFKVNEWFTKKHQRKKRGGRPRLNKDTVGIGSKKSKPHYWYGVPMNSFMDKLINIRKHYKDLYKINKDPISESKQRNIKLICNLIYGITASKYFNVSNLVFANNITGICRSAVWIKAKALNLTQTITDGGTAELNKANHWHFSPKKHKPGFNILALNALKQNNSYIKPLSFPLKVDWEKQLRKTSYDLSYRERVCNIIEKLTNRHVKKFLEYYKLDSLRVFPYQIEIKRENLFFKCTNSGRGHYALQRTDNTMLFKIRGTQQKTGSDHIPSPIFEILHAKMFNRNAYIKNLTYTKFSLVKTHELKRIRQKDPSIKLHDGYISQMCIKIKCDCGKFSYYNNYKMTLRKTFEKEHYSFLDPYFLDTNKDPCVLDPKFWDYHRKQINQKCLGTLSEEENKAHRFSKTNKKEFFYFIKNANKCDPNFKHTFSQNINNDYKEELKKPSDELPLTDFQEYINEIPVLTDDENDQDFHDQLEEEIPF